MEPVDQTIFGNTNGNCFPACLASILEIPLDTIPNFCATPGDWIRAANKWMSTYGLCILEWDLAEDGALCGMNGLADGAWVVISGKSPRGDFLHAVVGRYRDDEELGTHKLEYVHDPHPSRSYHDGPAKHADFFVAINPQDRHPYGKRMEGE